MPVHIFPCNNFSDELHWISSVGAIEFSLSFNECHWILQWLSIISRWAPLNFLNGCHRIYTNAFYILLHTSLCFCLLGPFTNNVLAPGRHGLTSSVWWFHRGLIVFHSISQRVSLIFSVIRVEFLNEFRWLSQWVHWISQCSSLNFSMASLNLSVIAIEFPIHFEHGCQSNSLNFSVTVGWIPIGYHRIWCSLNFSSSFETTSLHCSFWKHIWDRLTTCSAIWHNGT